ANIVVVELIVTRPEHRECGHGEKNLSARLQELRGPPQGLDGVGKVLEDVEHQDQPVFLAGIEAFVERVQADAAGPGAIGPNSRRIHLNAFDRTETGEHSEEETVSASDVEDRSPTLC